MAESFYITTPIYYVNGRPHIGHAYTTIAADAAARWQRARGRDVFFLTGTDEHGQKVLQKAEERGMTVQEHVDDMVVHWKQMMVDLEITNDHFMRTTQPRHEACVTAVLQHLRDKAGPDGQPLIYQGTYTGWYSTSSEQFFTDKDVVDGKDPDGNPVERIEERNWYFRMSAFQQPLIDHIEANPDFIQPVSRRNEVLGFLRKELGDLSISRPTARMSWGIPMPFDADSVTYVWFDALLNYISEIGFRPDGSEPSFDRYWPADVQLIGKDILTTHAVYWTTMLMALELPLPRTLYAHGWWLSADGEKQSKSKGNVIDVDLLVRSFGVDAVRFFLLREIAFGADGQFSYDGFLTRYNADLANDLGNLAHRGLSMTGNWLGGTVPARGTSTGFEDDLVPLAKQAIADAAAAMEALQFHDAIEAVFTLVRAGNKYIDDTKPWALNKAGNTDQLATVMRTVLEIAHLAGVALAHVIPGKSEELLTKLGRTPAQGAEALAAALSGDVLSALPEGGALEVGDPLFPRFRELPPEIAVLFEGPPEPPKPKKKAKKKKGPPEPAAEIAYEDFAKIALKVGKVLEAGPHPDADRLLVLKVDIGEDAPRQIVAGIADRFAPDDLIGRSVVVVANLAPAKLRGVESQGMLLAAGGTSVVDLVSVDAPVGEVVR